MGVQRQSKAPSEARWQRCFHGYRRSALGFDPVFAKYIKVEEFPKEARIDYMMAAKTLKWMKRVHDYGQDFIEKYGLKAHIFTIDVFPKPVNEKKENVNNNA